MSSNIATPSISNTVKPIAEWLKMSKKVSSTLTMNSTNRYVKRSSRTIKWWTRRDLSTWKVGRSTEKRRKKSGLSGGSPSKTFTTASRWKQRSEKRRKLKKCWGLVSKDTAFTKPSPAETPESKKISSPCPEVFPTAPSKTQKTELSKLEHDYNNTLLSSSRTKSTNKTTIIAVDWNLSFLEHFPLPTQNVVHSSQTCDPFRIFLEISPLLATLIEYDCFVFQLNLSYKGVLDELANAVQLFFIEMIIC